MFLDRGRTICKKRHRRGASYWDATASQRARGSIHVPPHNPPHITSASQAYSSHWQVSGVKCRVGAWHWRHWSVSYKHTHTRKASRCPQTHIWYEKEELDLCPQLGGAVIAGRVEWGPFYFSWSLPWHPVTLTYGVKIVNSQNVQLPPRGPLIASEVKSRTICVHWCVNVFVAVCSSSSSLCHNLSSNMAAELKRRRCKLNSSLWTLKNQITLSVCVDLHECQQRSWGSRDLGQV